MDILEKLLDSGATVDFRDRVRPDPAHWLQAWRSWSNSGVGVSAMGQCCPHHGHGSAGSAQVQVLAGVGDGGVVVFPP